MTCGPHKPLLSYLVGMSQTPQSTSNTRIRQIKKSKRTKEQQTATTIQTN